MSEYRLTLTLAERQAIDWVGFRYPHGDELSDCLTDCRVRWEPESIGWCDRGEITFIMPEYVAWAIQAIAEECDYRFDCFSPNFRMKLTRFCDSIV